MMQATADIVTARFRLRPLVPQDATERYSRWLDDAAAARYIEAASQPHDVGRLRQYIADRAGRRDVLFLGIFASSDGAHIGNIKYEPVNEPEGSAVMGILVGEPEWRGRGVAEEVIAASARWLRENRNVREILLGVARDHQAAIQAYEKIGFRVDEAARCAARPDTLAMVWRLDGPGDHRSFLPAVYNRIAALLKKIEGALHQAYPDGPVYERSALTRRLLQEVAFLLDPPLRRTDTERALRDLPSLMQERPWFRCAGMRVDAETGRVSIGVGLLLASIARFFALWGAMLALGAAALLGRGRVSSATVVLGVPEEGLFRGDDTAFAEFAKRGPVAPFNAARLLLVQSLTRGASSTQARILYARHPLFELLRRSPMGFGDFLRFAALHLETAARFLAAVARFPLLAILWRDFGLHAPIACLNERGRIEAMVITNSNWHRQLLCMTDLPQRRFDLHFVFYSQNDRPSSYVDVEERCAAFPSMRLLRAHHFWVWTPGHADLLVREGVQGQMHVAGPILWEIVRRESAAGEKEWVSVFDITPLSAAATREFGLLGNYYATENLLGFLDGIDAAARATGLRLPLVVKPKREPARWADTRYLSRLEQDAAFRQLSPTTSALSVVAKSAAVIVYPFSTVAYIADWLGVPVIYFDPTGKLAATHEAGRHIRFARGAQELAAELQAVLAETCPAS